MSEKTQDQKNKELVESLICQGLEDAAKRAVEVANMKGTEKLTGPAALLFFAELVRESCRMTFPHAYEKGNPNAVRTE